jgi:hypothetical protein
MWTPRRIFMSLMSLLISAALYFGYARLLGSLDGLPPLPAEYGPEHVGPVDHPPTTPNSTDQRIERAFGKGCPELRYPIKLEMRQKGILFCSHRFEIIKEGPREGWVEMSPLSLATFSERKVPDGPEEINTVYCDVAYVKFDKPIRAMGDLNGRKMMAAELHADPEAMLSDPRKGRVRLLNNRRTYDPNDDIEMVTPGPVYYDAEPRPGQPNIYTFTVVQIFDYLNTNQPEPDRTLPREPTMSGVGLRVFLSREPKDKSGTKPPEPVAKTRGKKDPRQPVTGVDVVGLDHSVEMNIWSDSDSSFVAPGGSKAPNKKEVGPTKDEPPADKRLIHIQTEGPFRYDLNRELAHFEKPANPKPGLVEHVKVTRADKTGGQDLLDCEYLDVQFHRKKPADGKDKEKSDPPPPKKKEGQGEGDLEVKSIRAWGETVVMTSDAEKLNASGSELIHDAEERKTILKGSPSQQVWAVKDGNVLRGSEMHLYGDEKQISQAHILGVGSIGFGDLDPKTNQYQKQASWDDRLVYMRIEEKGQPPMDVFTFISKDGKRAMFKDTSSGALQQLEAQQLKVWVKPAEKDKDKKDKDKAAKKDPTKFDAKKGGDKEGAGRVQRLEATGLVRSQTPDLVIQHADHLDVWFQDIPKLLKPAKKDDAKRPDSKGPEPRVIDPKNLVKPKLPDIKAPPDVKGPIDPKAPLDPKVPPKKEEPKDKIPFVVIAKEIKTWVNRDPEGNTEIDKVHAEGDVEAHQAAADKEKQGNDVAGKTVDIQNYTEGYKMIVTGDPTNKEKQDYGVVRSDKMTVFGYHIMIDQRNDTGQVRGQGQMEILSTTDADGKKLDMPSKMHILWTHRMDFFGADKLIFYHGDVQAFQDASRCRCEWMQVLLDRPVYLDPERRDKAKPQKPEPKPGDPKRDKEDDDTAKIDTVMCFHLPKDEDVPKPKVVRPVTMVEETLEKGKVIKLQSVQGNDIVIVTTPLNDKKSRHEMTVTASNTDPGVVRLWQPGSKDADPGAERKKELPKKDARPKKKGELGADEEMKLTIVQFGEKMWSEDFRKRAKFWTNIRVVHLPADRPNLPVDVREGDIPQGAIYMEARDTLEVFSTVQREKDKDGNEVDVEYQEMIAIGSVKVSKKGEFFGDADRVTYSEMKGTLTFYGSEKNPATVNRIRGQGIQNQKSQGKTIVYYLKDKTVGGTSVSELKQ